MSQGPHEAPEVYLVLSKEQIMITIKIQNKRFSTSILVFTDIKDPKSSAERLSAADLMIYLEISG